LPYYRNLKNSNRDIIFIHIPKTAGRYITRQLNKIGQCTLAKKKNFHSVVQHFSMEEIQSYNEIKVENTFIFSTIRNPISKILSTYSFFKNAKVLYPELDQFIDLVEEVVNNKSYADPHFVKFFLGNKGIDLNHFRPQHEMIKSEELKVNCYCIENDIQELVNILNDDFHVDISSLNFHYDHLREINESQTQRLKTLYRKDIEMFNY